MKDTFFSRNNHFQLNGNLISLPCVMGILNINASSFYAGSRAKEESDWLQVAEKHLQAGAAILDIGATSTRPGADISDADQESKIIEKVITSILKEFPNAIISVDTYHQKVAQTSIESGAHLINDISAGRLDDAMIPYILKEKIPYVAMHSKGTPKEMQHLTDYDDIVAEVYQFLKNLELQFNQAGHNQLILDPGLGFAKTIDQNFELIRHLAVLKNISAPLMLGISRKSTIYKTLQTTPESALNGTCILNTIGLIGGADILRVHDVKEALEVIQLTKAVYQKDMHIDLS